MPVDYAALAKQAREQVAAPPAVDYAAMAEQARRGATAVPIPAAATSGMLPPSTATSQPATGTLMDLLPSREKRHEDMGQMIDALPAAVPMPTAAMAAGAKGLLPSSMSARAGAKFQQVMGAAKGAPVDLAKPGAVALRIADLAQHGGGTNWGPGPIRQFIQYATDPKKPQMTYEVARDFYSNISKLSVDEVRRLSGPIRREVINLRLALHDALMTTAESVGKGTEYGEAMTTYARAQRMREFGDTVKKWALPAGVGGAVGLYAKSKVKDLAELLGGR